MNRFLVTLLVLASLMFGLTGCEKANKTVRELREKSVELSIYGGKLTQAFGEAYKAGEITQAQLADLNVATGAFTTALGIYRDALKEAERIIAKGEPVPTSMILQLDRIIDDQVIAAFFNIIVKVGLLPLAKSEAVKAVISAVRLTILAIKAAVSDAQIELQGVRNGTMA